MKIKGMSFSRYSARVGIYKYFRQDLFEFIFIKIILDRHLDKESLLVECLKALEIKDDLFYLFNNVYYKLVDNGIIKEVNKDFRELRLKDIEVYPLFIEALSEHYFPVKQESVDKEFVYDYLKGKLVVSEEVFKDSNVVVIEVDNSWSSIERLVNKEKKGLFNLEDGICLIERLRVDPYYFEIELKENDTGIVIKDELVSKSLLDNSFQVVIDENLKGNILTNNIYFECLYGKEYLKDYCDYLFVYDVNKTFSKEDKVIYVDYKLDNDFVDLVNKDNYILGKMRVNDDYVTSFYTNKNRQVSEFKNYLVKNREKFNFNLEGILKLF